VAKGSFENNAAPKVVKIPEGKEGRYIHFRALSEVNGNPWASAAEFDFTGCYAGLTSTENDWISKTEIHPVPASEAIHISLPDGQFKYFIFNTSGSLTTQGNILSQEQSVTLNISSFVTGTYHLLAINEKGIQFRMKFVKF